MLPLLYIIAEAERMQILKSLLLRHVAFVLFQTNAKFKSQIHYITTPKRHCTNPMYWLA